MERSEIEKLLKPAIDRIKNNRLKKSVIDAWLLACKKSKYKSISELKKMPFTLLANCRGLTFIEHTIAVTEGAIGLAVAQQKAYKRMPYPINMDILVAGGLLHDVGKIMEIEPDGKGGYRKSYSGKCARHPISGAIIASEAGLPEETVNIIICHAKEGEGRPKVPEAVLIHQADFATFDPLVMMEKDMLILG